MQSTHMASQQITEDAVYLCTGNPLPKDIEQISYWLLNESFAISYKRISMTPLLLYFGQFYVSALVVHFAFLPFFCT